MAAVDLDVVDWLWLVCGLHYCGYPNHQSYDMFAARWYRSKWVHNSDITLCKLLMIYCLVDRFKLIASDVRSVSRKLRRWITISAYSRFAAFVSIFVDSRLVPHAYFILHLFRTLIYHVPSFSYNSTPSRASAGFWLGGQCPLAAWGEIFFEKFDYEMMHSEVYLKKICGQHSAVHPTPTTHSENCSFSMFSLFNFSSIFPGGQLTPPYVRTPVYTLRRVHISYNALVGGVA